MLKTLATGRGDQVEEFGDGEVIVREGEESREMYVIQHGSVVVTKRIEGREVELARLTRGSFFGEMSLLESQPRNATVRADGHAKLLVIKPGGLLLKIRRDPTFAFEMLQHMSHRIRDLNDRVAQLMHAEAPRDNVRVEMAVLQASTEFSSPMARQTQAGGVVAQPPRSTRQVAG
ncbi:MAG TPA: cyclic nucleotide-binding domain-containing protein [Gemmatimonadaceae bacterium]|nr:cyclic nucleotide-binding domain-containing protein [Gemmatimonadaceae bacterium]